MAYLLSHRFSKIKVFKKNYTLYLTKSSNLVHSFSFHRVQLYKYKSGRNEPILKAKEVRMRR